MAVASSDLDRAAGKTAMAASKKAMGTEDPVMPAAIPGKTKIPLPSMAETEMATTALKPSLLSSFFTLLY